MLFNANYTQLIPPIAVLDFCCSFLVGKPQIMLFNANYTQLIPPIAVLDFCCPFLGGELKVGFQDVAFMPFRASFCTIFLIHCVRP